MTAEMGGAPVSNLALDPAVGLIIFDLWDRSIGQ